MYNVLNIAPRVMRVKVRFNSEAGQSPIIVDLRFLPRIGEKIQLGFRRVIEILEVCRVDNDSRYAGIVRAKYVAEERRASPAPPRPMPMPPINIPSGARPVESAAAVYANVNLEELAASVKDKATDPKL